jgi:hypothetical protein
VASVGLSLVRLVEQVDVNLELTSLSSRLQALHQEPWRFFCRIHAIIIVPGFFLSREHFHQHSPSHPLLPFSLLPLASVMKFAFKIKTKLVTQAVIIVTIIASSSGCLATIAIYTHSPPVSIFCLVVLAVIVSLALRLSPC